MRLALKRNNHFENENISLINDVKEADQETIYDKVDIEALMKEADLTQFYDKVKEEKLDLPRQFFLLSEDELIEIMKLEKLG